MASKKSKILAIAFCAAVIAGIHVNPVLAAWGDPDFNYQNNQTESGLNNPEIDHTINHGQLYDPDDNKWVENWVPKHPEGNVNCEDEVADSNITVGDMNKVTADLVANDEKIYSEVKEVASDVNSRVDGLENRVDGLEDRIDKVGAMAAAIANLRTMGYDPAAPTEVAVGVGQYRDETGMALGLFHYPNRDFMLSLSVSTSGDEYMGGIGATWKFGRKSPEKVAEIKKAQAEADARRAEEQKLAKAEEMKKAAKEAKVQAQMERNAKLAAERAALEEA